MSRAFVKEPEGDQAEDDLPDIPQSLEPNYIRPAGLDNLKNALALKVTEKLRLNENKDDLSKKTEIKQLERDIRFLRQRIEKAIVVTSEQQTTDIIRFGAVVNLIDENDQQREFTIVGEDEVCASQRKISWTSPLGRALIGKRAGETIIWERPVGLLELEIDSFHYRYDS